MNDTSDDTAAILGVAKLYYDGMHGADEAKLRQAFDPRASIIGNFDGDVSWMSVDDFVGECRSVHDRVGRYEYRLESLDIVGDTAVARFGGSFIDIWFSDYLAMLKTARGWSIVNKTFYAHPKN
jgi:hypothetical protein